MRRGVFLTANTHSERMERFVAAGLYLVVTEDFCGGRTTMQVMGQALDAGVRLVQLREKGLSAAQLVARAQDARALTSAAGALLIINDRVDVALAVGADGVHLGQDDMPVDLARGLGPELIIGASSHSVEEALDAEHRGASYVNIGPLFATQTKQWDEEFLGVEGLQRIAASVSMPFTVMGGIKKAHIPQLVQAGARTIAVVTAVTAATDPRIAAGELLSEIRG